MEDLGYNLIHRWNVGDALRRVARRHPQKRALVFGERSYTYAELDELVNKVANAMLALGATPGRGVAIYAPNSPLYLAAFFAAGRIGSPLVPINALLRGPEVTYSLTKTGATVLLAHSALIPMLESGADAISGLAGKACLDTDADGFVSFPALVESASGTAVEVPVDDDAPAVILMTSGTTAFPKAVVNTHRNFYAALISGLIDLGVTKDEVMLLGLPLFHVGGLYLLFAGIATGSTMVLLPRLDPGEALRAIGAQHITYISFPATVWIGMLNHPERPGSDLSTVKTCLVFQYMPAETFGAWMQAMPGADWVNYWGQTETTALGASTLRGELSSLLGAPDPIGAAHAILEVRIVDEEMREVADGQIGELVLRGPAVTPGYLGDDAANLQLSSGGWHHTGDVGFRDAQSGAIYFVDRKKDIIKTGGENVSSQEVEDVISRHPGVAEVAVVGTPDPYWVEAVTAFVVARAGIELSPDDVIAFAKERIAGFKAPKRVVVMDELPKNPTGKILKRILRENTN